MLTTFFLTATAAITGIQACELHHSAKRIVKIFNKYFRAKVAVSSKKRNTILMLLHFQWFLVIYDRWNNIPHYTHTEKYGREPCEPSLTSYYAHHSQFSIQHKLFMRENDFKKNFQDEKHIDYEYSFDLKSLLWPNCTT